MPSTYAHHKLGEIILSRVPLKEQAIIESYLDLFMIGIHGPDVLFYHKPLMPNFVSRTGFAAHKKSGREFFSHAFEVVKQHDFSPAYLSYLYGVICHYALDVTCHGCVYEKIEQSGISHSEIEVEFDRFLMVNDGIDPIRTKLVSHVHPSLDSASVICKFYDGVTAKQVKKAIKGFVFYNNLLVTPSKIKRKFLFFLLRLAGKYDSMHGMFVNYTPNEQCRDSNDKLNALFEDSVLLALDLINELDDVMINGAQMHDIYRKSFDSELVYNE